jgi:hypothetical protein
MRRSTFASVLIHLSWSCCSSCSNYFYLFVLPDFGTFAQLLPPCPSSVISFSLFVGLLESSTFSASLFLFDGVLAPLAPPHPFLVFAILVDRSWLDKRSNLVCNCLVCLRSDLSSDKFVHSIFGNTVVIKGHGSVYKGSFLQFEINFRDLQFIARLPLKAQQKASLYAYDADQSMLTSALLRIKKNNRTKTDTGIG